MENYYKLMDGDYIIAIGTGTGGEPITHDEYEAILAIIRSRPVPDAGCDYALRADLTWELVELPAAPEGEDEASEEDYIHALGEMGVDL